MASKSIMIAVNIPNFRNNIKWLNLVVKQDIKLRRQDA